MKLKYVNLITTTVLTSCFALIAVAAPTVEFAEEKKKSLEALEMRLTQIQKAKTCMTAAQDAEALRTCRLEMRTGMSEMHQQRAMGRGQKK